MVSGCNGCVGWAAVGQGSVKNSLLRGTALTLKDHTRQVSRAAAQEAVLHHQPVRKRDCLCGLFVAVGLEASGRTLLSLSSA